MRSLRWFLPMILAAVTPTLAAGPATPPAPAVTVVEAVARELVQRASITGTLVARDEILVTPEIDGTRITDVLVEEGARVERGQVMARLSRDLLDRQIAQQAAIVDKAAAAILQAESNIAQAEAAEVEARLGLDRARQLAQTGNATAVTIEGRTAAARQAEARLAFARNGLAVAQADLAQARAVRAELDLRLARTEIRAPEGGIVASRRARVGMMASMAGDPLFRIIARNEIELEGEVLETRIPSLRVGAPAAMLVETGEPVRGTIRAVYPEIDKTTRLGKVRVRLDDDPRLRVGAFARGVLEVARADAVAIPQAAILYGGARSRVLVVADGTVEAREVRTGLEDGEDIAILSGLAPGERVVAKAGSFLQHGDRVRPILAPPAAAGVASVARAGRALAEIGTP